MFTTKTLVTFALAAVSVQGASLNKRSTSGRATFYDVGMGNCGWQNSGSENVVALNTAQYGSTSQVSSVCGKTITINYNGKKEQATIVDSCPTCGYGDIDLSKSLFSSLTDGDMALGQMQVSWSWGSDDNDSSSSSKKKSKSSNNDSSDSSSSSSSSSSKSTPTSSSSTSAPTNTAQKTTEGTPQWWATIGTSGCDVEVPEGVDTAAIGPGDNANADQLQEMCGKWIQVWNTDNNKSTKVLMTTFVKSAEKNSIFLADAYKKIANMNGDTPDVIETAKWGFLN